MSHASTDPGDERFDVLAPDGEPAGRIKPRAEVHRDGDWHRAFHLWVAWLGSSGELTLVFQQRSAGKDTWPNRLDVAVGGHFRAGETLGDVVREVEEEIGLVAATADLTRLGARRAISRGERWYDREIQEVYALMLPAEPAFRPHPVELAGLVTITSSELERVFEGVGSGEARYAPVTAEGRLGPWARRTLARDDFVPVRDGYWLRGARAMAQLARGEPPTGLWEVAGIGDG